MVTRESLPKLVVCLFMLGAFVAWPVGAAPFDACGAGTGLVGVNPVVNGAMTLGSEYEPASDGVVGGVVQEAAGSAGGLAAANGYHGALGWTVSVASSDRFPYSDAGWSDHHGTSNSGVLWIHYDARDVGDEAVVVRQSVGHGDAGGVFCDAGHVTLDVVSDGPLELQVAVHTAERPGVPFVSDVVRIGRDGGQGHPAVPPGAPFSSPWAENLNLALGATGSLTMLELVVGDVGGGASEGSWLFVDNVAVFGTSAVPVPAV